MELSFILFVVVVLFCSHLISLLPLFQTKEAFLSLTQFGRLVFCATLMFCLRMNIMPGGGDACH